jgi:hypothetical protein
MDLQPDTFASRALNKARLDAGHPDLPARATILRQHRCRGCGRREHGQADGAKG